VEIIVAVNGHIGRAAGGATADFLMAPRTAVGVLVPEFVFFVVDMHDVDRSVAVNDHRRSNTAAVNVVDGVRGPGVQFPVVGDVLEGHVEEARAGDGDVLTARGPSLCWRYTVGCGSVGCIGWLGEGRCVDSIHTTRQRQ